MNEKIDIINALEAAEILRENGIRITAPTLREALLQGIFPWGWTVIDHKDQHIIQTQINRTHLLRWIQDQKM